MSSLSHDFHDSDLIAYLEGTATPDVVSRIENDPDALAEATLLRGFETALTAVLYRQHCPALDDLLQWQAGILAATAAQRVEQHVDTCPHCRTELAQLAAATPAEAPRAVRSSQPAPPAWRTRLAQTGRDILAVLRPMPLQPAAALRGTAAREMLYHAGDYQVVLKIAPPLAAENVRQLEGQITGHDNPAVVPHGARVALIGDEGAAICDDTVDEFGYFALDNVESGEYTLRIETPPDTILIEGFAIA
jgi:hypothetical protein